ncbi:GNAT family N-acetyltransferase [Limosilactobacillus antri]|uniref:Acetyltransferase, GNAT family n=1 Tax=Limosilactobacillus antri DSM 16041 TaxID=525309 RepID=C8P8I7_9LACO|nr:GNAT family N-acetyltransferase [Limosilactobacillus antri]EEW53201.1 acetyltransferase, GNAT family [Limosilactobacillus antri DSM 16041]KRK59696.1 GNAT family acetyltransferase [Limosilactobacillus antri DSM 16041]
MTEQVQGRFREVTTNKQDLAQLEAIMRETFTDTFGGEQSAADLSAFLDKNYNPPVLKRELADTNSQTFFYEVDGQPAAYLKVNWATAQTEQQFDNALEIQRIYVRKPFQKLHIGGVLMRRALEIAQQQNRDQVWLGVYEHNLNAQGFYQHFGFQRVDQHMFMVGTDPQTDFLLAKKL